MQWECTGLILMDKAQLLTDLRFIINEDPVSITHKGDTFNAVKGALNDEGLFTDIGKQHAIEFVLSAPIVDFGTTPETGDDITVAGTVYKIGIVDTDNVDVAYRIFLENETGVI